jgi:hypothetical protein
MQTNLMRIAAMVLALGAGSAIAADKPGGTAPSLKISGNATATAHWFRNSRDISIKLPSGKTEKSRGEKGLGTYFSIENSMLYFQSTGRMDTGWTDLTFYDWKVGVTCNTIEYQNIEENRLRLKGRWGTAMFGNTQGVENFMARGPFAIIGGVGGAIDGNYRTTTTKPVGLYLSTDMVGATKYATKFTYVTPRFYGVQFGVTYTPNSEQKGEGTDGAPHNRTSTKSPAAEFTVTNFAFGLNYVNKVNDDLAVALSATAVMGKTKSPLDNNHLNKTNITTRYFSAPRHRTKSYALGAVASYQDFELGVEWINNGKSQQIKNARTVLNSGLIKGGFNAGKAFSVGGAYTYGLNKFSVGYYHSKRKFNGNATANVYSLDYDRAIAPGFSVFAEGVLFDLKSKKSSVNLQKALIANNGTSAQNSFSSTSAVRKNNGRTVLIGAITKF